MMAVNRCRISSWVASGVTVERQAIEPSGAPALTAASDKTRALSRIQRTALGWGLMTIALQPLRAINALKMAVEVGFVPGVVAAATPAGTAVFTTPFFAASRVTPTGFYSLLPFLKLRAAK